MGDEAESYISVYEKDGSVDVGQATVGCCALTGEGLPMARQNVRYLLRHLYVLNEAGSSEIIVGSITN